MTASRVLRICVRWKPPALRDCSPKTLAVVCQHSVCASCRRSSGSGTSTVHAPDRLRTCDTDRLHFFRSRSTPAGTTSHPHRACRPVVVPVADCSSRPARACRLWGAPEFAAPPHREPPYLRHSEGFRGRALRLLPPVRLTVASFCHSIASSRCSRSVRQILVALAHPHQLAHRTYLLT
jgi:hypothetical protein